MNEESHSWSLPWHIFQETSFLLGVRLLFGYFGGNKQNVLATGVTSAKVEILARFAGFFRSLQTSPSHEVRTVALLTASDLKSTTGKNVGCVSKESDLYIWSSSPNMFRELLRLKYVDKLLQQRYNTIQFFLQKIKCFFLH